MRTHSLTRIAALLLIGICCNARDAAAQARRGRPTSRPSIGAIMDYGPFVSSSLTMDAPRPPADPNAPRAANGRAARPKPLPPIVIASRGVTVKLDNDMAVCFDTETFRWAAGWVGGYIDMSRTSEVRTQGAGAAMPAAKPMFQSPQGPAWAHNGSFADARPEGLGNLPADHGVYKGFYRHGKRIIFAYSVDGVEVLDSPRSLGGNTFARMLYVGPSSKQLKLRVATEGPVNVAAVGAKVSSEDGMAIVTIEPGTQPRGISVSIAPAHTAADLEKPEVLPLLCKGGPKLWDDAIETQGHRSMDSKAYVVDTIGMPENNPWHAWMRATALDFFSDGRAAVATMNGDIWIVSNIDADLQHVSWKRFATGLYEPLGVRVVNDQLYVLCRDRIVRLHDLANTGEADFYENFASPGTTSPIYHAFKMDLQTDSSGNFYYMVDGNQIPKGFPMHACLVKVSPDGKKSEVVATGFRAANGMGIGQNDDIICSDNQGHWTPVCRLSLVKPGGFYGYNGDPRAFTSQQLTEGPKVYDPPICWIPYELDNSTGGQLLVSGKKAGPLEGHILSTSYGKCRIFELMYETVDGIPQGATVELPLQFDSGIQRARMNPVDGQIYVCGLKGWQTSAAHDGCLQRIRYTGKPMNLPVDFHVKAGSISITFDQPLDPRTSNDDQSFGVSECNYKWSSKYGSDRYKPSDPTKVGNDDLDVKSAKLQPDKKTVVLEIPKLHPVMQLSIEMHIAAANGAPIECELDATINHVPGSSAPPVLTSSPN
jgi:hypothetical protein